MAEATQFKYRAFLSYSHRDQAWGKWLHSVLEGYRIDKDLVGRETPAGAVPKTLRPIFRDREDFTAGHSLSAQTLAALEASRFLIVICSPNAAQSKYVNEEVRRYKVLGRADRIIPVIVEGEPGDLNRECFPAALKFKIDADGSLTSDAEEPIAADARANGDGKALAKHKVISALLGIQLDELVRRGEQTRKRQNRFWGALAGVFLLLAVLATGSAVAFWNQLKTNEAFLDATLKSSTDIVNNAVEQAEKYGVPRAATLKLLLDAEKLFDHMARLGRPTPELRYRKALMLLEFANNYAILGNTESQRERANSALHLLRELVKEQPNSPELLKALFRSHTQMGDVLRNQGQLVAALKSYEEALSIAHRFGTGPGYTDGHWAGASIAYEKIGDTLSRAGLHNDALAFYRAQLTLAQSRGWRNATSVAHSRIANAFTAVGKLEEALVEYRTSLDIDKGLLKNEPTDLIWQRNVSIGHRQVGRILLQQQKLDDALVEYRAGFAIINALASRDSSNVEWQSDLAGCYGGIGEVLLAQGHIQEAIESHRKREGVLERLARSDPRNAGWQLDLAEAYASIADASVAQGNLTNALAGYRASHEIWERVAETDRSNMGWQMDLLWSHSRLAVIFGDESAKRLKFIVGILSSQKEQGRITPIQAGWLPYAEEGLAATEPGNQYWQFDLLSIYWRTASLTPNPVRQYALVVTMARNLEKRNELPPEQLEWLNEAEEYVQNQRQPQTQQH